MSLSISVLEKHRLHMRSKCLVPNHKDSSIAFLIYLSDILSIQTVFEMIQSIYMVYLFKNYCNIWLYDFWVTEKLINHLSSHIGVAPDFKNKTRYTPYVSPGSQISHIATNKGNIERQCSIYNILSINDITLNSKQRKDNSDLWVKTLILQGQLTGWSQA